MTIETGGNGLIHLDRLQEAVKEAKTTYHKELESIRNVRKDRIPIGFSTPEIWKTSLQHFIERWPQWKAERIKYHEKGSSEGLVKGPLGSQQQPPKDSVLPLILDQIIKNHI